MIDFSECTCGQLLRVVGFDPLMHSSYRRMLLSMGVTPQTCIRFLRRSPLGDPIIVAVRGSKLCLRQEELKLLNLEFVR